MLVLGIETSCDETAAALVADGRTVLSSIIATQLDLLNKYGGVVPEIAARRHTELIGYVINEALTSAGKTLKDIEAVAVTSRQGLIGCLLVGTAAAKSLSYALGVPMVGIHHIEGHIFANRLSNPDLPMPHVCLTVSGGHTMLLYVEEDCRYQLLGTTLDDAAGEAFDKVAKFLGLGFPGGPVIDRAAEKGDPKAFQFPRPLLYSRSFDFSFSGLKTAVINSFKEPVARHEPLPLPDIAASFQEAVVDVLVSKTMRAAVERGVRAVSVTGGVSANRRLRSACRTAAERRGLQVYFPSLALCTDNGAMVAAAGYARLMRGEKADLKLDVIPSVPLEVSRARVERVDPQAPDPGLLKIAADFILNNEVVVFPTDTGYAFGANALNETAIDRVFRLKGRSFDNPIHITVSSVEEVSKYARVSDIAAFLMRRFLPGGITLVLPRKDTIPARLVGGRDTVGIRIPDNKVILGLASRSGVPITSTSANLSGLPTPYDVGEVLRQLGDEADSLVLVLDQGPLPVHALSTILDLTSDLPKLLRAGVINMALIEKVLESYRAHPGR